MLAPLVMVIQLTELTAVHAQLEPVITVMLPTLPVDGTEIVVGETEYEHCAYAGRAAATSTAKISASRTPHRTVIHCPLRESKVRGPETSGAAKAALIKGFQALAAA